MRNLDELRKEIDRIDDSMRILFEQRMNIVKQVKAFKKNNNIDVLDKQREKEVISKNLSKLQDTSLMEAYEKFLNHLMEVSKELQR